MDTKVTNITVEKGRKQISTDEHGNISADGPDGVALYRLLTIKNGMEFEAKTGMRLTGKAPSCFVIAKRENGFKGNKPKIYAQFCEKYGFEQKTDLPFKSRR